MQEVSIVIAGTRTFNDYDLLSAWVDAMQIFYQNIRIVSGGAKGADALAERYAKERGIPINIINADWDSHGKSAGPKRNREMAKDADVLVAFWDGQSRGTANMIAEATKKNAQVHVVYF